MNFGTKIKAISQKGALFLHMHLFLNTITFAKVACGGDQVMKLAQHSINFQFRPIRVLTEPQEPLLSRIQPPTPSRLLISDSELEIFKPLQGGCNSAPQELVTSSPS